MYRGTYLVHRDQRAPNGTRDWQNKDGTWTEAGKARRRSEYAQKRKSLTTHHETIIYDKSPIQKFKVGPTSSEIKNEVSNIKDVAHDISKLSSSTSSELSSKKKYTPKGDYSNMSDEELQKKVKRLNLEKSYYDLTKQEIKTGEEKAKEILDKIGLVSGLVGSITGTALIGFEIANHIKGGS